MQHYHLHDPDARDQCTNIMTGGEGAVSGSAGSGSAEPFSMAESVTRHALTPPATEFEYLACGIDSLYVGIYVIWGKHREVTFIYLEECKQKAQGSEGLLEEVTPDRKFLFLPGGKPPNYRYHLKFSEYSLFISKTEHAKQSPNVYVEISAEALWKHGMEYTLELVHRDLRYFDGQMDRVVPSRMDVCCDFRIHSPLTLPFLQDHAVCRSRVISTHMKGSVLETCYFGSAAAPIRLRIYDKGKEILKRGTKLWFGDVWETDDFDNVWRVEFQLRREALKQFDINTTTDIWRNIGGLWHYLTEEWFTLRLPDNERQERRTLHPWWVEVMACKERLQIGPDRQITRTYREDGQCAVEWYIAHIAGCLPSFAARLNVNDYREAIFQLGKRLYHHWERKDFETEFLKQAIRLGTLMQETGGSHEKD